MTSTPLENECLKPDCSICSIKPISTTFPIDYWPGQFIELDDWQQYRIVCVTEQWSFNIIRTIIITEDNVAASQLHSPELDHVLQSLSVQCFPCFSNSPVFVSSKYSRVHTLWELVIHPGIVGYHTNRFVHLSTPKKQTHQHDFWKLWMSLRTWGTIQYTVTWSQNVTWDPGAMQQQCYPDTKTSFENISGIGQSMFVYVCHRQSVWGLLSQNQYSLKSFYDREQTFRQNVYLAH